MPSAEGLIHRASAQSGGGGNPPSAEESKEFAKRVFAELGVKDIAALQKTDWAKLNEGKRQTNYSIDRNCALP
jgi:para-nitrobenzyl esterase